MPVLLKRSLLLLLLFVGLGPTAGAEPAPGWAQDAVETLRQRELWQGYPEGQGEGQRALTRNELAELLQRLDEQRRRAEEAFSDRSVLEQTRVETVELGDGLDALEVRIQNLEAGTEGLRQREQETARPALP